MAGKYNIEISQGSDYTLAITLKDPSGTPINLTGHTFTGQIRKTASDFTIQAPFTFTLLDQGTDPGRVNMTLAASVSSGISLDKSTGASRKITTMTYDVESDNAGSITRWLEGLVQLSPEVTK